MPHARTLWTALLAGALLAPSLTAAERGARSAMTPVPLVLTDGTAEILRYSADLGTVVIGDSEIAVATIDQSDSLVLTALAPGETNAIVLDADGNEIDHISLRVTAPDHPALIWRGTSPNPLACKVFCYPAEDASPARSAAPAPAPEAPATPE